MIKTIKKQTKVEFAKNSIGVIAVSSSEDYKLKLQQMKADDKKVGQRVNLEDVKPLPSVELEFHNVASVDVLIAHLKAIKERMMYPHGYPFYLAC